MFSSRSLSMIAGSIYLTLCCLPAEFNQAHARVPGAKDAQSNNNYQEGSYSERMGNPYDQRGWQEQNWSGEYGQPGYEGSSEVGYPVYNNAYPARSYQYEGGYNPNNDHSQYGQEVNSGVHMNPRQ